ncbi:MAG TPA: ABC transporter permease [Phycisphaerae bacterium]|jgi:ribose transport system permease protein/erythritol transport system permease protein
MSLPAIPPTQSPALGAESSAQDARRWAWGTWLNLLGPIVGLLAIFIFFWVLIGNSFVTFYNIQTILRQSTVTCMAAIGATFVIISAGIDLSIGSALAVAAMVIASLLKLTFVDHAHGDASVSYLSVHPAMWPVICAAVGILIGLVTGLINGSLITGLRVVPFIVTLGTMMIYRGFTEAVSVVSINPDDNWLLKLLAAPDIPDWVEKSAARPVLQWLFLAPGIWITLGMAVIMALVLNYFRFGRHTIAIGSNEQTARLCGIPVGRTKVLIYLVSGFFAGLAGVMQYARQRQGSPAGGLGLELDVIAAVVIGGASLNGGKGSIMGTIVGSLIMTVIASGCSQVPIPASFPSWIGEGVGLQSYVQKIVTGGIIVAAVFIDKLRQRRSD